MARWHAFPHPDAAYAYSDASLKKHWARLHRGDREAWPADAQVREAWRAYHAGEFARALACGLKAGPAGCNAANKAACIYARYLEPSEAVQREILLAAATRSEQLQGLDPSNANAFYLHALALGRYGQNLSVARALAQGLGSKVRASLDKALALEPEHADAHIALGTFHAEVIDKVGATIGKLTYGARRDDAITHFQRALALNPESAIARIEYANALVMLDGRKALPLAEQHYQEAAQCKPMDAMERLDVELARTEIG